MLNNETVVAKILKCGPNIEVVTSYAITLIHMPHLSTNGRFLFLIHSHRTHLRVIQSIKLK